VFLHVGAHKCGRLLRSDSGLKRLTLMSGQNLTQPFVNGRAQQAVNVNYVNLAAVTILAYDTLLSIDDEIIYVWRSKWTFVSDTVRLQVYFDSNMGPSTCSTLYSATTYVMLAGIVLAETILLLRTYALWGLSRYVLWYIVVFDIGCAILAVIKLRSSFQVNNFQFVPSPIPTIRHCFPFLGDKPDDVYIDFVCVMAAELSTASRKEQYPDINNLSKCSAVDAVARSYALEA